MILIERQNRTSGVPILLERWGMDASAATCEFTWQRTATGWTRIEGAEVVPVAGPFDHPETDHPENRTDAYTA